MTPNQIRLIAYVSLFIALMTFLGWVLHLKNTVKAQALVIEQRDLTIKEKEDLIKQERFANELSNFASQQYAERLKVIENEVKIKSACIADGTCGLRIAATCPARVPTIGTDTAGIENQLARLTSIAERNYFIHTQRIDENAALYQRCLTQLENDRKKYNDPK